MIETFFEQPEQFKILAPELYNQTSVLLNQTFTSNNKFEVDCRESLIDHNIVPLSNNHPDVFLYSLENNDATIAFVIFLVIGILTLQGSGYMYPPAYICFSIAFLIWLRIEKNYTRLFFSSKEFKIHKGLLLFKNYKIETLPLSNLISVTTAYEYYPDKDGVEQKKLGPTKFTYCQDNEFKTGVLNCGINMLRFNDLAKDLKQNNVHVYIRE